MFPVEIGNFITAKNNLVCFYLINMDFEDFMTVFAI